jgi:mRNA interferase MazF
MKPGDVVLIRLAQVGGGPLKLRPAVILALLPGPYQNVLICGISTQLHRMEPNWDERIAPSDPDYARSGLRQESLVRLSYLYAADGSEIAGGIGKISQARVAALRSRLALLLQK